MLKNFVDAKGRTYSCVQLSGKTNYAVWAFTMKEHLKTAKIDHLILGDSKIEMDDQVKDALQEAKSLLLSAIVPGEIEKILHCQSAREIWSHFEKAYGKKTSNEKLELMGDLYSLSAKTASDVPEAVSKALSIRGKLISLGTACDDILLISTLMRTLPPSFATFLESWNMLDPELQTLDKFLSKTLDKAKALTEIEEEAMIAVKLKTNDKALNNPSQTWSSVVANGTTNTTRMSEVPDDEERNNYVPKNTCSYCRKVGHWKKDCRKLIEKNNLPNPTGRNDIVMMAIAAPKQISSSYGITEWIMDSGCSKHMTPFRHLLSSYARFKDPIDIRIGDNSIISAIGYGKVITDNCILSNTYLVPELGANLFSVSAASDAGIKFNINATCAILMKDETLVATADRRFGTYFLGFRVRAVTDALIATTIDDWHKRLNHLPKDLIRKMFDERIVDGLRITTKITDACVDCKLNKCRRSSHKTSTMIKAQKSGQSLHLDVIGPINPEGINKERFVLNCTDEFSKLRMVVCLKAKSLCTEKVKAMINQTELQTQNSVLMITTDNGTEFSSDSLRAFLDHKGITHNLSAPYVPQQNGTIERCNQTLLNESRTILNSAKMPLELWPEAINSTTYVYNRCISKTSNVTPYELWFGRKPNLNNLRIFGQKAVVFIQDHQRSKFQMKGTLMNFVGYTENYQTYKFLDPINHRIVISCDVSFTDDIGLIDVMKIPDSQNKTTMIQSVSFDFGSDLTNGDEKHLNDMNNDNGVDLSSTSHEPLIMGDQDHADKVTDSSRYESTTSSSMVSIDNNQPIVETTRCSTPLADRNYDYDDNEETLTKASCNDQQGAPVMDLNPILPPYIDPSKATIAHDRNLRKTDRIDYRSLATGKDDLRTIGQTNIAKLAISSEVNAFVPNSYNEAMNCEDHQLWCAAIDKEMQSMLRNNVYELVSKPATNIVGSRWVFTYKYMPDGRKQPKARLVAQGFSQKKGIDYWSTYSAVVPVEIVRLMFAAAAINNFEITQFDIKTAFLYGDLSEQIFMKQPPGLDDGSGRVWKLKKSIYGLKQAPRAWNEKFAKKLESIGLKTVTADKCIFFDSDPFMVLIIYVDDVMVFSNTKNASERVIQLIQMEFEVQLMNTGRFLGFQYKRESDGSVILHQTDYITEILDRFGMSDANSVSTPFSSCQREGNEELLSDNTDYRELIGCLQYLATQTRPDISFTVGFLSRKVMKPTHLDLQIAKRCLRYLKGTCNLVLRYRQDPTSKLVAYTDADFAGEKESCKSTSGSIIMFGGAPISWRSKLQKTVVTSTTEAEFMALSSTVKMITYLRNFAETIKLMPTERIPVKCDNRGAVLIASNETSAQRTRHMGAQLNYTRQQHESKIVKVESVPADEQLADIMTKPLSPPKFSSNLNKLLQTTLMISGIISLLGTASTVMIEHMNNLVWLPTTNVVEIGQQQLFITLQIADFCGELRDAGETYRVESMRPVIEEASVVCAQRASKYYYSRVNALSNTTFGLKRVFRRTENYDDDQIDKNRKAMLELTEKRTNLPETSEIGMSAGHYYATFIIPGYQSLFDRHSEVSPENVLKKHNDILRMNAEQIDIHSRQIDIQSQHNDKTQQAIRNLASAVQNVSSNQAQFFDLYPELTSMISRAETGMQRDADLLIDLASGFNRGIFDIDACVKLMAPDAKESIQFLRRLDREKTRIIAHWRDAYFMYFDVQAPMIDENTHIYKAAHLKNWIDFDNYKLCKGEYYILYNSTTNCTKQIGKPDTMMVSLSCTTENRSDQIKPECEYHEVTNSTLTDDVEPKIVRTNYDLIIQCFRNNITVQNETFVCPKYPVSLPLNTTIKIDGYAHSFHHRAISIQAMTEDKYEFTKSDALSDENNPWRKSIKNITDIADLMIRDNDAIKDLSKKSRLMQLENLWKQYGSSELIYGSLAILLIIIVIYFKLRKNPLVELMETSMVTNVVEQHHSHDSSRKNQERSNPINILINNQLSEGSKVESNTTEQNIADFEFPNAPPALYPLLEENPYDYGGCLRQKKTCAFPQKTKKT